MGVLKDRKFHHVSELDKAAPDGVWVEGLSSLILDGYYLIRYQDCFCMKLREREPVQDVADLVYGISLLPVVVEKDRVEVEAVDVESDEDEDEFDLEDPEVEDGLVVSDPSSDLVLSHVEYATTMTAILAKRKSGKSYLGMVLAEEMMTKGDIPIVIIDPVGGWFGLLGNQDGTPSDFKLAVLGGQYADFEIAAGDGQKAAVFLNQIRHSHNLLLDLSRLGSAEQHEFVADFIGHFYSIADRRPVHFLIDEADEFAPQRLDSSSEHQKRCLSVMDRMARRGRNKGIGGTLITQRAAVLNKNLLSQTESIWFLSMGDPNDLNAANEWLKRRVDDEYRSNCLDQLPALPTGVAYYLQSGASIFRRIKVRTKKTFDSSSTPTGNERPISKSSLPSAIEDIGRKIFTRAEDGHEKA